jgi:multiple sugar transport system substrate-binding protein
MRRTLGTGGAGGAGGAAFALALALAFVALAGLAGCGGGAVDGGRVTIRMWAMGREGEVVGDLARDFEKLHPDIHIIVQQIPWTAAHEKLLTAHVGGSTPDIAQLGNTWVPEFVALHALEPLDERMKASSVARPESWSEGIWQTNVIDGVGYGVPWYVDTRVLFYRSDLLRRAGYARMPESWTEWREALRAIRKKSGNTQFGVLLPTNEYTQPVLFGLQNGATLLADHDTRGAFSDPKFREAYAFLMSLYAEKLAPPVSNNEIANMYQEFERGTFAMVITGPWNLGEFKRRLPPELADSWSTAPLPGPTGKSTGVSLAGGSSLGLFARGKHKDAAWSFIEYLSAPEQQARFYQLTGDLPAHRDAWPDSTFAVDPRLTAFRDQLERVVSSPKVPEWESIGIRLQDWTERAVRGTVSPDSALAGLDRDVDRMLEKRRWLLARGVR